MKAGRNASRMLRELSLGGHARATAAFVADQAVCSAGNFATSLLIARTLATAEFGVFALLNIIVFFSLTVNNWLLRSALSEQTSLPPSELRLYTGTLAAVAAIFGVVPGLVLVCATWRLGHLELAPVLLLVAIASQAQETLRRSAMAQTRYRTGIVGDCLCYALQALLIAFAAHAHALSLVRIFWLMLATSLASLVWQVASLGLAWPTRLRAAAASCWKMGRWVTLSGLVLSPLMVGMPWIVELTRGHAAAGMLSSLLVVLGLSNPIMFSSTWLILSRGHGTRHESLGKLLGRVGPGTLLTALPLLGFWSLVALFPQQTLRLFYAAHPQYDQLSSGLRVLTLYFLLAYLAVCLEVLTDTRQMSRNRLGIDALTSLLVVTLGLAACYRWGMVGLLWIGILAQTLRACGYVTLLLRPAAIGPASLPLAAAVHNEASL